MSSLDIIAGDEVDPHVFRSKNLSEHY